MGFPLPKAGSEGKTFEKVLVPQGMYRVALESISDPKLMKKFNSEEEELKSYFNFKLIAGPSKGVGAELSRCVNVEASLTDERSNIHQLIAALTCDSPALYAEADSDFLLELECNAVVTTATKQDGITKYSKITQLLPLEDEEAEQNRLQARHSAGIPLNTVAPVKETAKPAGKPNPSKVPAGVGAKAEEELF